MPNKFSFSNAKAVKSEKFKGLESDNLKDYKMRFAFDQISLKQKAICFNNPAIEKETYLEMIEFASHLSSVSLADIIDNEDDYYNFHLIDLHKKYFLKPILQNIFAVKSLDDLPEICQIRAVVQDDEKNAIAPRIIGYFGENGIFHLLFFDYYHAIYRNSICQVPPNWHEEYY